MSAPTRRENLLRVFSQQPVECIPVAPFIHVNYVKEFFGTHEVDWVVKTPEVYRHFGFDVIHRNCTPIYDAYGPAGSDWQVQVAQQKEGRDETNTTIARTPKGDLRAVQARRWICEYDAETSNTEYWIKSEADLDLLIRYQPPPGVLDTSDLRSAKAAVGDDGIIAPWIQGAFNLLAVYYRKIDELLVDALVNPNLYHRLMTHCLERYKVHVQQIIDARPDALSYAGNVASGKMVGPDFYRRFVMPYEKEFIEWIQGQGVAVLYHNCGYARKLLPLYPGLGMGAYESLTPPPHGDTILSEAVAVFGKRVTLLGNIDQIDLLRTGSPAEIDAQVKQTLDTARGRCHFVLATTDYFNDNTPHENIHALADAARRYCC